MTYFLQIRVSWILQTSINTLFEIFMFCPKIQLWFPEKIVDFFGVKNSWKCCGFGLFSCWQLWFHEKNCQKNFWVKNLSKLNCFFFFFKIYFYGQINDFEDSVTLEERLLRLEKFVQILNAHDARSAHFIFWSNAGWTWGLTDLNCNNPKPRPATKVPKVEAKSLKIQ